MLQLFGYLALLLANSDKPQEAIEITAEGGCVVAQSGDLRFKSDKLQLGSGKLELELSSEGDRIVLYVDGLRVKAGKVRYNPASGILSCKGDAKNKARLSIMKAGGWQLDKEAKTIFYYIGGAVAYED